MEAGSDVGMHVNDVRIDQSNQRTDHLAGCHADKLVLLRGLTHNRRNIDRVFPPRQLSDMKHGELGRIGIVPKMVTERPFDPTFPHRHNTFQNEFGV